MLALPLISGCAIKPDPATQPTVVLEEAEPERPWRGILQPRDLDRINGIEEAWRQALAAARGAGFARRIRDESVLLEPAAALLRPAPAPGSYRCRVIRIAAGTRRQSVYSVRGPFFCFVGVEGPLLSLTRQTGTARPGGYLYDDTDRRQVFIGAEARDRERVPPAYASNAERDVVGILERVADFRYRLVIPRPSGATLEVYELVPALG